MSIVRLFRVFVALVVPSPSSYLSPSLSSSSPARAPAGPVGVEAILRHPIEVFLPSVVVVASLVSVAALAEVFSARGCQEGPRLSNGQAGGRHV